MDERIERLFKIYENIGTTAAAMMGGVFPCDVVGRKQRKGRQKSAMYKYTHLKSRYSKKKD